eukprot:346779-Prymnesium_polylepis.2
MPLHNSLGPPQPILILIVLAAILHCDEDACVSLQGTLELLSELACVPLRLLARVGQAVGIRPRHRPLLPLQVGRDAARAAKAA